MLDNIGFSELVFIFLIVIVFFGPRRIPEIARTFGKLMYQAKKAFTDIQDEIKSQNIEDEISKTSDSDKDKKETPNS
ncbi:MAG: Sec-independent protein translocase protein TatB [Bacteroidetes bacterium]|nr:Sec-independent protein translocase protein TatB [Bacteroidota bacterium]